MALLSRKLLVLVVLGLVSGLGGIARGEPVGTAFTYQGQLKLAGRPVDGATDFRFSLWNDDVGGVRIGQILTFLGDPRQPPNVDVRNGLFTVALDFGESAYDGQAIWLQIEVRHPDGDGPYTLIAPRQNVTIVPYAVHALNTPNGYALDAADGSPTNSVFVNNDGNVGIRTIDPESALTVNSPSTDALRLFGPGAVGSAARLHFGDASYVYLEEDQDDYLTIYSFQRTAIMGGNVGIGTTTPGFPMTFPNTLGDKISLWGQSGPHYGFGIQGGLLQIHSDTSASDIAFGHGRSSSFTETMRIKGNGNVGIGIVTPAAKLDVNAALSGTSIAVYARSHAAGLSGPAIRAHNSHSGGIAIFSTSNSSDANLVITNEGTGDLIRGFSGLGGGSFPFRVENNGKTTVSVLTITGGSDLAEPFFVGSDAATERRSDEGTQPGMVVVIDPKNPGRLKLATEAYDRKVAGIISGANGLATGMMMSAQGNPLADGNHPVALTGRVWCRCECSGGPIEPGDLLTTSNRTGHAMKVSEYARAHGAILGKAMTPLAEGTGLVLVLVSLQ